MEPSRHIHSNQAFSMLSADTERELFCRWRDRHDISAADRLAGSHLRLIVRVARSYRRYGLPVEDLIGEGHVGVMRAICRFDPDRAVRFSAYASWWVRSAIQEYVVRNGSLARIATASAQEKLLSTLRRLRRQLQEYDELRPMPEPEIVTVNPRLAGRDCGLNRAIGDWQDLLADEPEGGRRSMLQTLATRAATYPMQQAGIRRPG